MAKIIEWDQQQKDEWSEWVKSRPEIVQDLCKRFPPYNLYKLKSTGHKVTLYSYSENGTLTVNVSGEYNAVVFDRQVFGIKPEDLEECDLPNPEESVGAMLTEKEDVKKWVDYIRPSVLANRN